MDASLFAQVNTTISVRETHMLTEEQLSQMLYAKDDEAVALLLQATNYSLDKEELRDPNLIEKVLVKHLAREYTFAFQNSPLTEVVQIFSLKYTYHNLKVLLKERASQGDLSHLLLPIGRYPLDILKHLVTTLSAEYCPDFMQEEVASTWAEYMDYQDVRVLDTGMDLAYFKHLKHLSEEINDTTLNAFIDLSIDFYNVITVKRALTQGKPRSFMRQLLSENARMESREYLKLFENQELLAWFNQIYPNSFDLSTKPYEEALNDVSISALSLEYLADLLKYQLLEKGRFEIEGPLPLARYLWGKEMEVKNLRLILTGRSNDLNPDLLKERMRPVYGQ